MKHLVENNMRIHKDLNHRELGTEDSNGIFLYLAVMWQQQTKYFVALNI